MGAHHTEVIHQTKNHCTDIQESPSKLQAPLTRISHQAPSARASRRRCAVAHGLEDAEGIVDTMSKWLAGVRPGTASGPAPVAGGW